MIGILLINLGTPTAPTEEAVRQYLDVFLSDPYVITLPKILRDFLVQKIILPKRPKISAQAYQKIWTPEGSPLMVNSIALQHALQEKLGGGYCVALGMRYNHPSIPEAIAVLQNQRCETIIVLPLFPQFADATTQSALTIVQAIFKKADPQSSVHIIPDFYNSDYYIKSCAHMIQNAINNNPADYILFSYHGLPARQLAKKNCAKQCQLKNPCPIDHQKKTNCYRAQCYATTDLIAQSLGLHTENYQTVFQSRLGFSKWIGPYTDHTLHHLRKKNITALSVVCPSFVADCVETLEEINMRLRAQWLALGGKSFSTIPCLNADRHWVNALGDWLSGIG